MRQTILLISLLALVGCESAEPPPVTNIPDPATVGTPVATPPATPTDKTPEVPVAAPASKAAPAAGSAAAPTPPKAPDNLVAGGADNGDPVPDDWNKKLGFKDLDDMYPKGGRPDMVSLKNDVALAVKEMKSGSDPHLLTLEFQKMLEILSVTLPGLVSEKKYDEAYATLISAFELGHNITRENLAKLHGIIGALKPGQQPDPADNEKLSTFSNNARGASSLMGFTAQGLFVFMHAAELPERKAAFEYMMRQYKLLLKAGGGKLVEPNPGENPYFYVASNHAGNIGALLWIAQKHEADAGLKAAMQAELEKLSVRKTLPPQPKGAGRPPGPPGGPGGPGGAPGSMPGRPGGMPGGPR